MGEMPTWNGASIDIGLTMSGQILFEDMMAMTILA
jgi:hypothetical protein